MNFKNNRIWGKNGVNQKDRLPKALSENYIAIDNRNELDMLRQIYEYAKNIRYYNSNNEEKGDWTPFFKDIYNEEKNDIDINKLDIQILNGEVKPHLALLLSFLKLFKIQQNNLNKITERHLEFYYKDILGFTPKQGEVGNTTIFLESSQNDDVFIPKGTLFNAGTDTEGGEIKYLSIDDFTLNKAKIKNAFLLSKGNVITLNSTNSSSIQKEIEINYFGFILSSPLLDINDGSSITIKISTKDTFNLSNYKISYTGENSWIDVKNINNNSFNLTEGIKAYNNKKHGLNLSSSHPMLRFIPKNELEELSKLCLKDLKIDIEVKEGTKNITIENQYGITLNQIGALPFGAFCKKNDYFFVKTIEKAEISRFNLPQDLDNNKIISKNKNKVTLITENYDQQKSAIKIAQQIIQYSKNIYNDETTNSIDNLPQVLTLTSPIKADYTIRCSQNDIQIFSITPYEIYEYTCPTHEKEIISQIKRTSDDFEKHNSIQLSFEGISKPTILSFYIRLNPYIVKTNTLKVGWHFLNLEKEWSPINANNIIKNTTKNFTQSGIVYIKITDEIIKNFSSKGNEILWLKATIGDEFKVEYIQDIRLNALELKYDELSEGIAEPGKELPMGTITKFVNSITGVKKIEQPYSGEMGLPNETNEKFKCRISEKLRHKGNAWTPWDYERLVLEKFPEIAIAKCIPNVDNEGVVKAGNVLIIVTPNCNLIKQDNPLQPSIGNELINSILDYLKEIASPFVSINISSPHYVEAKIRCSVKLKEGYDDTSYYKSVINKELIKLIAPWSDNSQDVSMVNEVNESKIMYFIENIQCVDYVENFSIDISPNSEANGNENLYLITSADKHDIKIL